MSKKKQYERPIIQRLNTGMVNKYGSSSESNPVTHLEQNSVTDLINKYGSPLFVISEKTIRSTYRDANRAFKSRYPKVQFAWSYKTNYINAICNIFHQEGSWAEVVSGFEYQKAIQNKVPGKKIIFNGPDKSASDLKQAIDHSSYIHIDNFEELLLINKIAETSTKRPRVAIRVNMETGVYPMWDRFGFNYENGEALSVLAKIFENPKLDFVGLHCHIGTFMLTPNAYSIAASKLSELSLLIKKKYKRIIEYIDIGGGFASKNTIKGSHLQGTETNPSFDKYAEAITTALLNVGFSENNLPILILETGRALIDEAGYLLGSVISNKRLSDGRRAVILDFGVNTLFTSFWYDHKISPAQPCGQYTENSVMYGPLCMNIDVIRENIAFPLLQRNDKIVVHSVGAYNMTQWMQFISYRPAVILIDENDKPHIIRKRETIKSIEDEELLPNYLKL